MLQRFSFGKMIPTGTVVNPVPVTNTPIPYLSGSPEGWSLTLSADAVVYGLGETVRGINKRGWHYVSWASDDPHHVETRTSLYAAHNFLLVSGSDLLLGIFVDFGGRIEYDVGYTRRDLLTITPAETNYDLYLITGDTEEDIARQLRQLTGRSYIPPRWGFGYGQSRWGYINEADIRAVAEGYRSNGLPLDHIYMDIDYMERYIDFSVNKTRFPDLSALSRELKAQGIRLIPIIDAGVKQEAGQPVFDEGEANGYFCKKADGSTFLGAVWPGWSCFTDFLNPEARRWFGQQYRNLTEQGIEGFWNDMNEPAIFYTPDRLAAALDRIEEKKQAGGGFDLGAEAAGLPNALEDYQSFYHNVNGEQVRHDRVHNLYGYHMTRAASEALAELRPGQRSLLFARSSCIGAHRYGGIWLGDNHAWWSHLKLNLQQLPNVNLCGFLYSGADLGGFGSDTTPDLLLRWIALGIFTPLMRNHSALGTRERELYRFPEELDTFRNLLRLRYALLPYLYSEYMKAALEDGLLFRPLAFAYREDPIARQVEDQLLLGEGLMIAPVVEPNAAGRVVYLPESMKLLRLRTLSDYDEELLTAGHHYVACGLNEVLIFLRPGAILPLGKGGDCEAQLTDTPQTLTLHSYLPEGKGSYRLYWDDGETTEVDNKDHWFILTVGE